MTNYDDVVLRWMDRALGRTTRQPLGARNSRMYSDHTDRLYSYGSHFELGRFLKDRKGHAFAVMLNGDRYSPTTSKHQSHARNAARRSGLPTVIVPYSALHAAGILLDTVQIVDVQPDRNVVTDHEFFALQPGWQWRNDEIRDYVDLSEAELNAILDAEHVKAAEDWERCRGYALDYEQRGEKHNPWRAHLDEGTRPQRKDLASIPEHRRRAWRVVRHEMRLYTSGISTQQIDVEQQPDGRIRYSWQTTRHWLGASLIRAQVDYLTVTKCRTCAGQGSLPGPDPLGPDFTRNDSQHSCRDCNRGRRMRHRQRWAYFLSDFDHQEPQELYFFCELPRGPKPTTCEQALEALKPDTVRIAEQMGRTVRRQGDIFAIALERATKRDLVKAGAHIERMGRLLNTNHVATEVARMPDGQTLVRGVMHHRPDGRRPDHRRVRLDSSWHIVVKNTVPISGGR